MGFELISQPDVKRFFKKLLIFLALLVAADFLVGSCLRALYFSQDSGLEARTIYAIEEAKEDVIILGSSRAAHHYVPDVLSEEMRLTAYNAGREGNFILYHNAVLQCMATRFKPKVVILDILNKEFDINPDSYDRLANLMPFYRSHKVIRPIIDLRGPFEPVKNLSFIYPYNSKLQAIAMGNLEMNKKRKQDFKGYIPLNRVMHREPEKIENGVNYPIDSLKVDAFRQLIETCKNNNIHLFVVCSPYYDHLNREDKSVGIARRIAEENGIPFWDFSNSDTFVGKAEIFDDKNHLNEKGATLYSRLIAGKISSTVNQSQAKR